MLRVDVEGLFRKAPKAVWKIVRQELVACIRFSQTAQTAQFPADLVTFTEEILNGKLHFFAVQIFISPQIFIRSNLLSVFEVTEHFQKNFLGRHPES